MKKDFLTITPESGGGGTASVSAVAAPNLLAKERSTTINFSATGGGEHSYNTDMRPQTCLFETKRTPRPQVCSKLGQGTRSMDMG